MYVLKLHYAEPKRASSTSTEGDEDGPVNAPLSLLPASTRFGRIDSQPTLSQHREGLAYRMLCMWLQMLVNHSAGTLLGANGQKAYLLEQLA